MAATAAAAAAPRYPDWRLAAFIVLKLRKRRIKTMAQNLKKNMEIVDRYFAAKNEDEKALSTTELPIDVATARAGLIAFGKEFILNCGLNFSEVEAELGPNWIDDILQEYGGLNV
jgi:hypothetical protein